MTDTDELGRPSHTIRYMSPDLVADAGRLSDVLAPYHQTGAAVLQALVAGEGRPTADGDFVFKLSLLELAVPDHAIYTSCSPRPTVVVAGDVAGAWQPRHHAHH